MRRFGEVCRVLNIYAAFWRSLPRLSDTTYVLLSTADTFYSKLIACRAKWVLTI